MRRRGVALLVWLACLALPLRAQQISERDWSWRLRDLDGREVTLEQFRGEVVFLNVWATWCRPCVAELGSIERLARSLEGTGVRVLTVSPEKAERVRRFLAVRKFDVPAFVEANRMPPGFGLVGIPSTWILDREGRVVLRHQGAFAWDAEPVRLLLRTLATGDRTAYNSAEPPGPRPD